MMKAWIRQVSNKLYEPSSTAVSGYIILYAIWEVTKTVIHIYTALGVLHLRINYYRGTYRHYRSARGRRGSYGGGGGVVSC